MTSRRHATGSHRWRGLALLAAGLVGAACAPEGLPPVLPAVELDPLMRRALPQWLAPVEAAPADGAAHWRLGLFYEANQMHQAAVLSFDQALQLGSPMDALCVVHAIRCLRELGRDREIRERLVPLAARFGADPAFAHELALAHLEDGELIGAQAAAHVSIRHDKRVGAPWITLSEVLLLAGEPAQALEAADEALRLLPDDPSAHQARGNALRALGRGAEAAADLARGLGARRRPYPDEGFMSLDSCAASKDRLMALAADLVATGRFAEAEERLRRILSVIEYAEDKDVLNNLALAVAGQGRHDEALVLLRSAERADPDYFPTQQNLADQLFQMRRPAEAVAPAQRAVEIAGDNADARELLGRSLLYSGRPRESLQHLVRCDELAPGRFVTTVALGEACLALDDPGAALPWFEKAARLKPAVLPPRVNAARCLMLLGRYEESEALLEELMREHPDHPNIVAAWQLLRDRRAQEGR